MSSELAGKADGEALRAKSGAKILNSAVLEVSYRKRVSLLQYDWSTIVDGCAKTAPTWS